MNSFSIGEAFKFGIDKFRDHIEMSLLSTIVMFLVSILGPKEVKGFHPLGILLIIAVVVLTIIVRIGYTKIYLKMADGQPVKIKEIFTEYKLFWKYLGVSILMGLAIMIGFILLIIPGIIFALMYSMAPLILIDTNSGVVTSMKESAAITKGNRIKLLFFFFVACIVNFVGLAAFGLGLLFTVPVTMFASIHVYRTLSKMRASVSVEQAPITPVAV